MHSRADLRLQNQQDRSGSAPALAAAAVVRQLLSWDVRHCRTFDFDLDSTLVVLEHIDSFVSCLRVRIGATD